MVAIFPSHANFTQAAHALVDKYKDVDERQSPADELGPALTNAGWTWMDHPKYPTFGYLRRTSTHLVPTSPPAQPITSTASHDDDQENDLEVPDPSSVQTAPSLPTEVISVIHHIVYSPTYRAPQLLVQAHSQTTHAPLTLSRLLALSLIRPPQTPLDLSADASSLPLNPPTQTSTANDPFLATPPAQEFPDDDEEADFPLLAQAEHPSTSEGVWALHPCHTQQAVEEVMANERGGGVAWLEAWLMIVSTIIDLRWRP